METTIAAISTAMSASGIGIIRISGENAMDVISRIYRSKGGKKKIKEVPTHTIHYGYIYDGEELIDEVLVMIMHAPRTFTGEDTVEIDCHGGVYAMQRVLDTVLKNGAEIAEPGEFTKRAFLNGRMDLSQAEAVMDVIQAKNEYALRSSMDQLRGSVQKAIRDIREKLIYHIAYIESVCDSVSAGFTGRNTICNTVISCNTYAVISVGNFMSIQWEKVRYLCFDADSTDACRFAHCCV